MYDACRPSRQMTSVTWLNVTTVFSEVIKAIWSHGNGKIHQSLLKCMTSWEWLVTLVTSLWCHLTSELYLYNAISRMWDVILRKPWIQASETDTVLLYGSPMLLPLRPNVAHTQHRVIRIWMVASRNFDYFWHIEVIISANTKDNFFRASGTPRGSQRVKRALKLV